MMPLEKIPVDNSKKVKLRTACCALFFILVLPVLGSVAGAEDYLIGEGDQLLVTVWGEKDLSTPVVVRPDGKITLPGIGEVKAATQTVEELQTLLTAKMRKIVKNPIVTVMVGEITNNKVYIFGGGVKSGVFTLAQRTTLLQLLCQIEDVKKADLKKAYLLRKGNRIKEDFTKVYLHGETSEDVAIEPNDLIYIPTNMNKNVYVMGAVMAPKFIEYREGLTVMEAILEAGGFTKFANQNDTVIYRKDGPREKSIPARMKKLINDGDLTQNHRLHPGDYIVVKEGIF